jgi:predicted phosphoribosyltransferase
MLFRDRTEAGQYLARKLEAYADRPDVIVLALPRGGVPVAFEVAQSLRAPLDVFLVRKLGVPGHEELAMGALASGGLRVLNEDVVRAFQIPYRVVDSVIANERQELERRERLYRGSRPVPNIRRRAVILVDDGLATGSTMRAAVAALRQHRPARIVVAVPVASTETCAELRNEADEAICAMMPEPFYAVGAYYHDFSHTTDAQVRDLLRCAMAETTHGRRETTSVQEKVECDSAYLWRAVCARLHAVTRRALPPEPRRASPELKT